jgi:carboxypeptidase PM20D1
MLLPILLVLLALLIIVAGIVFIRALTFAAKLAPLPEIKKPVFDALSAGEHLGRAIRCQTISTAENTIPDTARLSEFRLALREMYPLVYQSLQFELVNDHALLYTWPGRQPGLKPVLFIAHQDVVPVDPTTLNSWSHLPFKGIIANGFVWGRGAQDMKGHLISLLEAVETLLTQGYRPERTVYLGFGHDEEVGGPQGAGHIARHLQSRGVRLAAVLDEGLSILDGAFPGITEPVALIGNAEKGYLTLEFTVDGIPGHASMPPVQTPIGILAAALARLEASHPPVHLEAMRNLFRAIGRSAPFSLRLAFANLWLLKGLVVRKLAASPQTHAAIRTTTALTVINGGIKDNILPRQATAKVNFRIFPGETIETVSEHVRRVIADERVKFKPVPLAAWNPVATSPVDTPFFRKMENAIHNVFGSIPVAPFLMLAATDSRHFDPISDAIYRFSPEVSTQEDMRRIHGIDERLSLINLGQMVAFFTDVVKSWSSADQ